MVHARSTPNSTFRTGGKAVKVAVSVLQFVCGVHLFNNYVAEIRPCTGASMYPTLSNRGSYILHSPLALSLSSPARGELVTAISPLDPSHQVLKRIVGLGGDEILVDPTGERGAATASEWVRVPRGYVWLAGDNASNSTDSRDYGPVSLGLLKGKVVARVWPNPAWLKPGMRRIDSV